MTTPAAVPSAASALWSVPFDHETIHRGPVVPNPNATDHLVPFGGWRNPHIEYYEFPLGNPFDWRDRFNAVHMALIAKGPHRGKVLVWGASNPLVGSPVLVRAPGAGGPHLSANEFHSCAPWSIVDPSPSPAGPRFRNFLLPIDRWQAPAFGKLPARATSLFCSGQAWSPHGDLIVAGGTHFGPPTLTGATMTFAFNPARLTRGWAETPDAPLYPGEFGLWVPGAPLQYGRFYPTTTLTARLQRLARDGAAAREVMLVLGGSVDDASDDPRVNTTWNSYEGLVIEKAATFDFAGFTIDEAAGARAWKGPGSSDVSPPPVMVDWLEDYPRCHLLSTGRVLFSGYAPRWAQVDHDATPGIWTRQASPPYSSTDWQLPRHDDTSLLLPNAGGIVDMLARIGGSDEVNYAPTSPRGTTASIEVFVAGAAGTGAWVSAGQLPNPHPGVLPDGRYLMNVVMLPDASLLLVGGVGRFPEGPNVPIFEPLLYKDGAWRVLPPNTLGAMPSVRDYHSTAVLLPDGRVMIGGGNGRKYDYEFFLPPYLALPRPANVQFVDGVELDPDLDAHRVPYASPITIACGALPAGVNVQKVVLMAPGATTHHSDMSQRYVEMEIVQQQAPDVVTFQSPRDDRAAPRGIYMLFLVTSEGGVSEAIWVVLV
jgi:hypothetical protein